MSEVSVLFVCLGNICRSPMAEGLFAHKVNQEGLNDRIRIDSAGTGGWHVGEPADPRMRETAAKRGVTLHSRARKFEREDHLEFDYILAMDRRNKRDILALRPPKGAVAKVILMRDFDDIADSPDVPDPYYGGDEGFREVYNMLDRATERLLQQIREEKGW